MVLSGSTFQAAGITVHASTDLPNMRGVLGGPLVSSRGPARFERSQPNRSHEGRTGAGR